MSVRKLPGHSHELCNRPAKRWWTYFYKQQAQSGDECLHPPSQRIFLLIAQFNRAMGAIHLILSLTILFSTQKFQSTLFHARMQYALTRKYKNIFIPWYFAIHINVKCSFSVTFNSKPWWMHGEWDRDSLWVLRAGENFSPPQNFVNYDLLRAYIAGTLEIYAVKQL